MLEQLFIFHFYMSYNLNANKRKIKEKKFMAKKITYGGRALAENTDF